MKKRLVKVMLTAAMIGAMFIGGKSLEVKAITDAEFAAMETRFHEEFAASKGVTVDEVYANPELRSELIEAWVEKVIDGDVETFLANICEPVSPTKDRPEMLDLVNADRAANGKSALVWDEDLAAYANQRAMEAMYNFHSEDFAIAYQNGGDWVSIAHAGCRAETGENLNFDIGDFGKGTAKRYNKAWIKSSSHHSTRLISGLTKYAAASYTDPDTGDTVWVELFEYGTPNSTKSSFDYMRYAEENPDVAAAFGQNKDALYNHYITYGATEGRKAYYTNGAAIESRL